MSEPYQEIVAGETYLRLPPGERHESLCERLHEAVLPLLAEMPHLLILPPREPVEISPGNIVRPDLAVLHAETAQPWLFAEVVNAADHLPDTVDKKCAYEDIRLRRLWMIDPRYNNVEVYQASRYGIVLAHILHEKQSLTDSELPSLNLPLQQLFAV